MASQRRMFHARTNRLSWVSCATAREQLIRARSKRKHPRFVRTSRHGHALSRPNRGRRRALPPDQRTQNGSRTMFRGRSCWRTRESPCSASFDSIYADRSGPRGGYTFRHCCLTHFSTFARPMDDTSDRHRDYRDFVVPSNRDLMEPSQWIHGNHTLNSLLAGRAMEGPYHLLFSPVVRDVLRSTFPQPNFNARHCDMQVPARVIHQHHRSRKRFTPVAP